jgi:hypothetical protein
MDITEFLTACLDEEQADAERLPPYPWKVGDEYSLVLADDDIEVATSFALSNNQMIRTRDHIVRYDPDRALREVAAKRRVLARHHDDDGDGCYGCGFGNDEERMVKDVNDCPELRDMASIYADRPGYKEEWKP